MIDTDGRADDRTAINAIAEFIGDPGEGTTRRSWFLRLAMATLGLMPRELRAQDWTLADEAPESRAIHLRLTSPSRRCHHEHSRALERSTCEPVA